MSNRGTRGNGTDREPDPATVVADADVLAADLLAGGDARRALDHLRSHAWTTLVASDPLLDDAEAIVGELAADALAGDWRERVEQWRTPVDHPPDDHPALASAYHGGAMHVLTLDESLLGARAGVAVRSRVETSVRHPKAFATLFDAESLYREVVGGEYPGPDRDPRE
jgi:predicted nucleic acid-binding protein